jgi:amino acid adenylation domain-containing protein/non-ribosomal peptide synthase protein (TIGR01720 family)
MEGVAVQEFRLSPQQRHLWSLEGQGPIHASQAVVRLAGRLDRAGLRRAVAATVARHEVLRTTFRRRSGVKVPFQVVAEAAEPLWNEAVAMAGEAWPSPRHLREERLRLSLDEASGSLLRASLGRLDDATHVLVLTLPALCADSRSLGSLVAEIARAYGERGTGNGEEPVQFLEFSEWQHGVLEDPESAAGRQHWRELDLSTLLPLKLPFPSPPAAGVEPEPLRVRVAVEPRLKAGLEAVAAARQADLPAVLLTCWQLLLWRLTGQADIVVGAVCDGRKFEELRDALGLFARAVPVHARWEPHFRFRDMLRRVRQALGTAVELQELLVRGEGEAPRGLGAVEVHFEVVEEPSPVRVEGVEIYMLSSRSRIDRCRLKLVCVLDGDSLALELEHDPRVLPSPAAGHLAARLLALLESAAAGDESPVGDLDDVGQGTRHWLLRELNDTVANTAVEPVHLAFERWARRRPERIAVRSEEEALSYGELNRRANRLAVRLRALGVGPETVVPLFTERSIEMVVGLLGILKAGGAYLPLDPGLPRQRLAFLLEETCPPVLVAQRGWMDKLPPQTARIVDLDGDPSEPGGVGEADPAPLAGPGNAVYVLFTSGSTGQPKGVVVEHRQLAGYVAAVSRRLDLGEGASYALVSTFAADLGNTVLFPALCSGGCLHVISGERATDPRAYAEYAHRHGIDCLKIVPTHFSALLQTESPERVVPRRLLVLGGEACSWELVEQVASLAPDCRVLNHYGPTETTVGVTTQQLAPDPWPEGERPVRPPLGLPLANGRAYVLGADRVPVAPGATGELYLGGGGVTRGYLGRPELTAERFVPDPFGPEPGVRLYRTGDLVRRAADGRLEFIGRADDQVKLRGFRIELGEIETALAGHPQVRATAVVLREDEPDKKRLVAYVVPSGEAPGAQELREHLQERLPDSMVPSSFVFLAAFPLTPNGKLDRRSLPAPDVSEGRVSYAPPTTGAEARLAEIWQEILRLDRVGIYESFFALGGDSILAIQVIARARKAGLELQPWQIFQHQTIADLAAAVASGTAPVMEQGPVEGEVCLTPIQHWFFTRKAANLHHWNQAALLETHRSIDPAVLEAALARLQAHHDMLRTRFEPAPAGWRQVIQAEAGGVACTRVDLTALPPSIRRTEMERAAEALQGSLNISLGPLLRAAAFFLEPEGPGRLLLIVHHLVVDGVSWRFLIEDLRNVYDSLAAGEEPSLPPRTSSFPHWAERLYEHVAAGKLDGELAYWSSLAGARIPPLPMDHSGGCDDVGSARTLSIELTEDETRLLLQEVPAAYRTQINDVLLTALAMAFRSWTGGRLMVRMEGHGREPLFEDVDLSRTVGWFTVHFPVLLQLPEGEGDRPGECLKAVKEQLRRAPARGIGFGLLKHLGDPETRERLSAVPAPQVTLNYLGQFDQVLSDGSWLRPARESCGPTRDAADERDSRIEVTGMVLGNRLRMAFTYGGALYDATTVESLAESFRAWLRELIAHCVSPEAGGFTPSDFPLAGLDEESLGRLSSLVSRAGQPGHGAETE